MGLHRNKRAAEKPNGALILLLMITNEVRCCYKIRARIWAFAFLSFGRRREKNCFSTGNLMSIDRDLEKIALQEKRLRFKHFDAEVAWAVGTALKAAAEKLDAAVVIDIQLHGFPLFSYAMPGTTPDNWEWIRRKRNVVMRYHRSSYAIGLKHERAKTTLHDTTALDLRDYSTHGGCFPVFVAGTGCVGTITVSGLPQREDHALVVSVLQDYLQLSGEDLALDAASGT
jgi:uncharacterized protein (UPF0303 family)